VTCYAGGDFSEGGYVSKLKAIWILALLLPTAIACPAYSAEPKPGHPQLTIISPRPGQTFDDTPIFIKVAVKNFKLVPPVPYFGKPGPQNVGHIHVIIDSYPLVATAETQLMIGKMAGDDYLPEGKHTLWVDLSVDNHDELTPPVRQKVTFYTMHPRQPASGRKIGCRRLPSG